MQLIVVGNFRRLYKYTNSCWLDSIFKEGIFRIGTLYEFREVSHPEIGDAEEGLRQFGFGSKKSVGELSSVALNRNYPKLRLDESASNYVGEDGEDMPLAIQVNSPDCYLFCMTEVYDKKVMKDFGYDVCLEITDPIAFFGQLSCAMVPYANFGAMEACQYESRYGLYERHAEVRAQIIKPEYLCHQKEVRITWDPQQVSQNIIPEGIPLNPLFVNRPQAVRYLRKLI